MSQNTPDEIDEILQTFFQTATSSTIRSPYRAARWQALQAIEALITAARIDALNMAIEILQGMKLPDREANWTYNDALTNAAVIIAGQRNRATLTNDEIGGEHGDSK